MKNTSILTGLTLAGLALTGIGAYAADTSSTGTTNIVSQEKTGHFDFHRMGENHSMHGKMKGGIEHKRMGEKILTEAEKTQLASMTDTEKKAFFETKMKEKKAEREQKEAVIDKLIHGETLSTSEKTILETIKTERAERKAEMKKREEEMTKVQTILDKKTAGTSLTTEEQAILDTIPHSRKK